MRQLVEWALGAGLQGVGAWGVVHQLTVMLLGIFFLCSGTNKCFHAERHREFCDTLAACHVPWLPVMRWVVAGTVLTGGVMLVVGLLVPVAAGALFIVILYATVTDGIHRIETLPEGKVINGVDYVAWQLYLPEIWYMVALLVPISLGAPPLSIDRLLLQ